MPVSQPKRFGDDAFDRAARAARDMAQQSIARRFAELGRTQTDALSASLAATGRAMQDEAERAVRDAGAPAGVQWRLALWLGGFATLAFILMSRRRHLNGAQKRGRSGHNRHGGSR